MADEKLSRLLSRFARAATEHQEALEALDEVRANQQAGIIAGLYRSILSEGEAGQAGLFALTESRDKVVAGMAAVYSLRYRPEPCVALLRSLAAEGGLLGFRAGVALDRWETGEWEQ